MITRRETPQVIARTESKTRFLVRVNMCLSSGAYSRALDLLRGAAAEFPNDSELSELEKLATDGVRRKAEADRLITESQELFAQQKSAKAIELLRGAFELDKHNSLARTILANSLVEHAQSIVETDWWEAETLANEALALNPAHPTAKTIHSLILDQKNAASVEEWISQTRKLQSAGNLSAALAQIAEAFAVYPHEPKLLQIQDTIQRDHAAQRRQARRRDLDDLRHSESEINALPDIASKIALAKRIQALTVRYSTDGEILSVANALLHRLESLEVPVKSSTAPPENKGAIHTSPTGLPEASLAATSPVPPNPVPSNPVPPSPIAPAPVAPTAAPAAPVPPAPVAPKPLPPGLPTGIVPPPSKVPRSKFGRSKVPPRIAPPVLLPSSNVPAALPDPQLRQTVAAPTSAPATPAAKITAPSSQPKHSPRLSSLPLILGSAAAIILLAAIFFLARKHHAPPAANIPLTAPPVSTPAVSASAVPASTVSAPVQVVSEPSLPPAHLSSDATAGKVPLDDQPPAEIPGHNLGTLLVVTSQDSARVFLNGKLQRQLTQGGQLRLPNLELKQYVVQVAKTGFQDPPQQAIRIRKGEQARLIFNLQPLPSLASLTIQGGAPGTSVLVDQAPVGTVQSDSTLSVSSVSPGDHTVELRKERFKPRQFKKHFVAGAAVSLVAADAALEAAPGELRITFAPADAKVVVAKAGVLPTMVSSGVPLTLAAGTYTLTARNADSFTRYSTLEVTAGQSKTLDLSLAPNDMSRWDDPAAWKHEGDSYIRKGGDFVLYGVVPPSGTFVLSAMLTKGRLLQWVANYTDPRNYVLFQMDDNNFYRSVIHNGQKTDAIIVPDKGDKKSFRVFRIRVSPTEIVHQIKHGDRWTVLDHWSQPGVNLGQGKFGFYLPGNDEVALSGFSHYVDLNLR